MDLPKKNKDLDDFLKANKELSHDEKMKAIYNIFDEEEKQRKSERNDLKRFAEENSHLERKEKSYNFIEYYYDNYAKAFGDYELLILLISRGKNIQEYQSKLYTNWKLKEKSKIENAGYTHSNSDTGESKVVKHIDNEDLFSLDVSKTDRFKIPDFWGYHRKEANTIGATMLRITEWCQISGFEGYWKRLVHDIELSIPYEIEEKYRHILWLYSTCRSDFALELMNSKLLLLTDIYAIPNDSELEYPWKYISYDFKNRKKHIHNSAFVAAGIVFSIIRLGKRNQYIELVEAAIEFLINAQLPNGSWKPFSGNDDPSIETTALCIHALAITNPDDFSYAKNKAKEWLYSKQDIWGMWFEDKHPYITSEFLTVLVLDAIELTENNFEVLTFNFQGKKSSDMQDKIESKNIYNIEVKGGTNIIGEQAISESPINSRQNLEEITPKSTSNKFWWIPRLSISILIGLVIAYLSNKYLSFNFWDTFISSGSIVSAFLLLRNPIRRFYRAGWSCIGIFSAINLLPQLDILFKVTESNSEGVINKLFKLGIQDEPVISIFLIVLSGFLFWLDSKEK